MMLPLSRQFAGVRNVERTLRFRLLRLAGTALFGKRANRSKALKKPGVPPGGSDESKDIAGRQARLHLSLFQGPDKGHISACGKEVGSVTIVSFWKNNSLKKAAKMQEKFRSCPM
jgi:hypothetical protein